MASNTQSTSAAMQQKSAYPIRRIANEPFMVRRILSISEIRQKLLQSSDSDDVVYIPLSENGQWIPPEDMCRRTQQDSILCCDKAHSDWVRGDIYYNRRGTIPIVNEQAHLSHKRDEILSRISGKETSRAEIRRSQPQLEEINQRIIVLQEIEERFREEEAAKKEVLLSRYHIEKVENLPENGNKNTIYYCASNHGYRVFEEDENGQPVCFSGEIKEGLSLDIKDLVLEDIRQQKRIAEWSQMVQEELQISPEQAQGLALSLGQPLYSFHVNVEGKANPNDSFAKPLVSNTEVFMSADGDTIVIDVFTTIETKEPLFSRFRIKKQELIENGQPKVAPIHMVETAVVEKVTEVNPKPVVSENKKPKIVLQPYDKKEEWDFEANEPAPAPVLSPFIVSYEVEMPVLREVERACDRSVVATGVLIAVARNKDGSPKMDRNQVHLDLKRDICPDGSYVAPLFCGEYDKDDVAFSQLFPNKEHQDALALGYPQGAGNLVSLLGLTFIGKIPNVFNGIAKLTSGSVFARDDRTLNLTTVASGLLIPVMNSRGDIKEYTIPGEIFITAKTQGPPQGGLEMLSVSTSNELLERLLKHKQGNPSLQAYGYELLNDSGELDSDILALAIECAKDEERAARANLEGAMAQFKAYREQQDVLTQQKLKDIEDKIERHTRKRGHSYQNGRLVNGDYVVTLSTAMAIALYRDLPAVLSGKKQIEACPLLLKTIVWCGVPELSKAITDTLLNAQQGKLERSSYTKRLSNLLKIYAKGDDKADVAQQNQEKMNGSAKSDDKANVAQQNQKKMNGSAEGDDKANVMQPKNEEILKIKAALDNPSRTRYEALRARRNELLAKLNQQKKQKKKVRMGLGTGTIVAEMMVLTVLTVVTGGLALVPIIGGLVITGLVGAIGLGINEGVARVRQKRVETELAQVNREIHEIVTSEEWATNEYMRCSTESLNEQLIACEKEEMHAQVIAQQRISDDDLDSDLDIKGNSHHNERDPLLPKGEKKTKTPELWTGSSISFLSHHADEVAAKMKLSELQRQVRGSTSTTNLEGH